MDCPHCRKPIPLVELPVTPLFSYAEVCSLVPAKYSTLRKVVGANPHLFERRFTGTRGRGRRLFTGDEVKLLRSMLVRGRR
jgi:hypothetical protein